MRLTASDLFHTTLRERFGFDAFRPGQLSAIQELFASGRLLCIQPTGHGKSLLYQLPACILPGIVLVISPLLALMRDQTDQLQRRFRIAAGSINSDQSEEENHQIREAAAAGGIRLLFLSPEQLDHVDRFSFFLSLRPKLVVIDEAHCVSSWGHDFRPGYRQILRFVQAAEEQDPDLKILGLTATASKRVEEDIRRQIFSSHRPASVLRESMDRPNLTLSARTISGIPAKLLLIEQLLGSGTSLIYCATRDNTEITASHLQKKGIRAIAYHAGLDAEEKKRIQNAFMRDEFQAIAATNALGMGIDKPNIRLIIHCDVPGSITAYYQEVGRAGRDGRPAQGVLLYDPRDREIQKYFIESSIPAEQDFEQVLQVPDTPGLTQIKQATGLHPTRVQVVVATLVEQGFLTKESMGGKQVYRKTNREGKPDLSSYATQRQTKLRELRCMIDYAEQSRECRMMLLRRALGDPRALSCGRCDACSPVRQSLPPQEKIDKIQQWLLEKPLPIAASRMHNLSEGLSLLDSKLRSPLFIRFMKTRQESQHFDEEILNRLLSLLNGKKIVAIVPLPSRTWKARESFAKALSDRLKVPLAADLLSWKTPPEHRQGELFNNEQRKYNVHEKMQATQAIPEGALLLLDDYIGSGATLKEAARALYAQGKKKPILIPLALAVLKWRLGAKGFV